MDLIKRAGECQEGVPLVDEELLGSVSLSNVEARAVTDIGGGEWLAIGLVVTHIAGRLEMNNECALRKAIRDGNLGDEGYIPCTWCKKGFDYKVLREKEN